MRSQWIRVGPKSSDWSLYERKEREIQTHRRTHREDEGGGWDWSSVATNQGTPQIAADTRS